MAFTKYCWSLRSRAAAAAMRDVIRNFVLPASISLIPRMVNGNNFSEGLAALGPMMALRGEEQSETKSTTATANQNRAFSRLVS